MKFSIKLLESNSKIRTLILEQIKTVIEQALIKATDDVADSVKLLIQNSLRQEPEYISLMSGTLKAEFGIPDSSSIERVILAMTETLRIVSNPVTATTRGLSGVFSLTMMKSDNAGGVIYDEIANVTDNQGQSLPWLEWLLLRNNQAIIKKYKVRFGSNQNSRSGLAIMVPSGDNWRVPPEFAGSQSDNWTTRAVTRVEDEIYRLIQKSVEKYI